MKLAVLIGYVLFIVAFLKSVSSADVTTSDYETNEDWVTLFEDDETEVTSTLENNSTSTPETDCDPKNFSKNDTFLISNQTCDNFLLNLEFDETSIIKITMRMQIDGTLTDYENIKTNRSMRVDIYERTVYENGSWTNVLQEEWTEKSTEVGIYLSLSSRVYINVSRTGNWSDSSTNFTFNEIKHRLILKNNTDLLSGEEEVLYEPNSVTFYTLNEMMNKKLDGIKIEFENLNIDKTMGEYLLIGPGTELFENEHFKPLYITELTENSKFYVGCDTAYVAFVSGSTQKEGKFKILWKRIEAQVPDTKEDYLDNLKSSPICFWRNSTENRTLPLNIQEGFTLFRKDFAEFINRKYNHNRLNKTSIILFGYPTEETINTTETLEIMVKVIDKERRSIFRWSKLQVIIGEFENNATRLYHGYRVRKCFLKELPHKDEWSIVVYALAPMFALLALLIWAWKQNIFAQRCRSEGKDELSSVFPSLISSEPNTFENTTPKNCETFDDAEQLNKFRSRKSRPSIQSLRDQQQEGIELELTGNSESNETEHLYYPVNGTINTRDTKL